MGSSRIIEPETTGRPDSQIGATVDMLYSTIDARRASGEESYTYRLLNGPLDDLLKKVGEEAFETALAAKDLEASLIGNRDDASAQHDHMRYECGDVIYHVLVLAARYGIDPDELAAELNQRMKPEERPDGCVLLKPEHLRRRL